MLLKYINHMCYEPRSEQGRPHLRFSRPRVEEHDTHCTLPHTACTVLVAWRCAMAYDSMHHGMRSAARLGTCLGIVAAATAAKPRLLLLLRRRSLPPPRPSRSPCHAPC